MNDPKLTGPTVHNYLVFEQGQTNITEHNYSTGARVEYPNEFILVGYNCIGAVKAKNENDAVRAVMARTRRISRYAVIEAQFIDFTVDLAADEVDARPVLNP